MFILGDVLGAGIYALMGVLSKDVGGVLWTFVPVLGLVSCVVLLTQQSAKVWLFGGILLAVGAVLYGVVRLRNPLGRPQPSDTDRADHADRRDAGL